MAIKNREHAVNRTDSNFDCQTVRVLRKVNELIVFERQRRVTVRHRCDSISIRVTVHWSL